MRGVGAFLRLACGGLLALAAGCAWMATKKSDMEKEGYEVKGTKVMRVFRF